MPSVFSLDTYAAVKNNLVMLTVALLATVEFVTLTWFLTPGQRGWVLQYADQIGVGQIASGVGVVGILAADGVVAFSLVELFRLHELWDTLVSHWRVRYDVDFILPRLIKPFDSSISEHFWAKVRLDRSLAMTMLYYKFVGESEPVVRKTLVVRFYGAVRTYWLCQYLEMALALVTIELGLFALADHIQQHRWEFLVPWIAVSVLLAVANRYAIHKLVLPRVEAATGEEIDEIVREHRTELEAGLADLHGRLGLPFAATTTTERKTTPRDAASTR
jgi:hypothetical protein